MKTYKKVLRGKNRRAFATRNKIRAAGTRPRLSVNRSTKHITAQVIDDAKQATLCYATTVGKGSDKNSGNINGAKMIGKKIAELALAKGIKQVAFDRGSFKYHGRIKAVAEAARAAGLDF